MQRISANRGFTLAEVMVAAVVMLMPFGALFLLCHQASLAMLKGSTQSGLLGDVQVLGQRWSGVVQKSRQDSLSLTADGQAMSVLDAQNDDGRFQFEPGAAQPRWQRYLISYYDATQRELKLRNVSTVGSDRENGSGPIETYGPQDPLNSYLSQGTTQLRHVDGVVFSLTAPATVTMSLSLADTRHSQRPETLSVKISATFRN